MDKIERKKKTVKIKPTFSQVFSVTIIIVFAVLTLIFFYLYINETAGYLYRNRIVFSLAVTMLIAIFTSVSIVFQLQDKSFVYRLCLLMLIMASIVLIILYLLKISGFWERVDSVEDMREFIASYGSLAVIMFVSIQFLQVVILPIPGIISIGAGVALFGVVKSGIYSFIGIMLGSLVAFFIGRLLGYKAVKWLVGDGIDKTLNTVKGKDKIVLSFMFLFPFFPDDILCFVAGMSSMSVRFYLIMITLTRLISVLFTVVSMSGYFIPYNTWWGLTIWAIIFIITIIIAVIVYKKGEKIESFFANRRKNAK